MVCPNYKGETLYEKEPAVSDKNLVTASGIAPLEFAVEVLKKLDVFAPDTLRSWYKLNKTQKPEYFFELMNTINRQKTLQQFFVVLLNLQDHFLYVQELNKEMQKLLKRIQIGKPYFEQSLIWVKTVLIKAHFMVLKIHLEKTVLIRKDPSNILK